VGITAGSRGEVPEKRPVTANNIIIMLIIIVYHIISARQILAKEQYIKRHDIVCAQLHFNICKETGAQVDKKHWYEHVPKSVETS